MSIEKFSLRKGRKLTDIPGIRKFVDMTKAELVKVHLPDNDLFRANELLAHNPWLADGLYVVEADAPQAVLSWGHKNRRKIQSFIDRFAGFLANGAHQPMLDVRHFDDNAGLWNGNQRFLAQQKQASACICIIIQGVDESIVEYEGDEARQALHMRVKRLLDLSHRPDWKERLDDAAVKRMCSTLMQIMQPGASNKGEARYDVRVMLMLIYASLEYSATAAARWPASHSIPNPRKKDMELSKKERAHEPSRITTGFAQACCAAPALVALAGGMDPKLWGRCLDELFSDVESDDAAMQPIQAFKLLARAVRAEQGGTRDAPEKAMYYGLLDALWAVHTGKTQVTLVDTTRTSKTPGRYMKWRPACALIPDEVSKDIYNAVYFNHQVPKVVGGSAVVETSDGKILKIG